MRIKKTSEVIPRAGHTVNTKSDSTTDAYSCDYSNKAFGGKLLWTNSSPTTSFEGQTIQVDLSDYDAVQIISTGTNNSTHRISSGIVPIGYTSQVSWYAQISYYVRTFNVSSTGVTFQDATDTAINTGSYGTNNNTAIPLYIIGYKTGLFS